MSPKIKKDPVKKIAIASLTGGTIGVSLIVFGALNRSLYTEIVLILLGLFVVFMSFVAWRAKSWEGIGEFVGEVVSVLAGPWG